MSHTWLSDSKSPCYVTTVPWLCMVIPGNLPQRIATPRLCMVLPVSVNLPRHGAPGLHTNDRQLAQSSRQTNTHTHTHSLILVGAALDPTGPDSGNKVALSACLSVGILSAASVSRCHTPRSTGMRPPRRANQSSFRRRSLWKVRNVGEIFAFFVCLVPNPPPTYTDETAYAVKFFFSRVPNRRQ